MDFRRAYQYIRFKLKMESRVYFMIVTRIKLSVIGSTSVTFRLADFVQMILNIDSFKRSYTASKLIEVSTIGGSRGGAWGTHAPPGRPNSFDFMQFSGKFGVFTPPLEGSRPPLGKILDPPLSTISNSVRSACNRSKSQLPLSIFVGIKYFWWIQILAKVVYLKYSLPVKFKL